MPVRETSRPSNANIVATVVPDTFTHGTSKQRMGWFNKGFSTGDVKGAAALFDLPYERL